MGKLVFIRHAQASYMAEDYDNLSDFGIEQSKSLGEYFNKQGEEFDHVVIGPLKRHKQTYDHCYSMMSSQIAKPVYLEGLREHHGPEALRLKDGDLEHIYPEVKEWRAEMDAKPELVKRNSLRIFRKFMADWMDEKIVVDHPSVMKYHIWKSEVHAALEEIFEMSKRFKNIAVFTSGGTIGCVIAKALGVETGRTVANLNDSIRNTSMSHFHNSSQGFNVLSFNEIPHLTKEQITFV